MTHGTVNSMLLASTDPERLRDWYVSALAPANDLRVGDYLMLTFGEFHLMIDRRDDVGESNPEPGRMILNVDVDDARAVAKRIDQAGTTWLAELEDRDGSLFATAVDPDGNYVQIIQIGERHRREMQEGLLGN